MPVSRYEGCSGGYAIAASDEQRNEWRQPFVIRWRFFSEKNIDNKKEAVVELQECV